MDSPMFVTVPLSKKLVAIVSPEDAARVLCFRWHANQNKKGFYARGWVHGRHVLLHRFILEAPDGSVVDHRDLDRLNCTRENMRICTHSINIRNQMARGSTPFKGVDSQPYPPLNGRFRATIRYGGKTIHLGYFCTAEEAALAYDARAREYYADDARFNFPRDGEKSAR